LRKSRTGQGSNRLLRPSIPTLITCRFFGHIDLRLQPIILHPGGPMPAFPFHSSIAFDVMPPYHCRRSIVLRYPKLRPALLIGQETFVFPGTATSRPASKRSLVRTAVAHRSIGSFARCQTTRGRR
jgi:hypothetical protein